MGKRLGIALLCGIVGYLIGAFGGGWVISNLSSNSHDRSIEAAMTGAFVTGPIVAIVSAIVGFVRSTPRRGDR